MANESTAVLLIQLRRLANEGRTGHLSDRQLLAQFVDSRDADAFAALVDRHGPMVWRVCRRTLPREQDAEDAFQAVFLILMKKAATERWQESIAGWLYAVAVRVALKVRRQSVGTSGLACASNARPMVRDQQPDPLDELTARELLTVLDDELARLPEKYRTPVFLCLLDGRTQEEAARQTGWSLSTVRRRLEHGRDLLQRRLARRGIGLAAGLGVLAAAHGSAGAAAPRFIAESAIEMARGLLAGKAVTGMVAVRVVTLAEGMGTASTVSAFKVLGGLVLTLAILAGGAGLVAVPETSDPPPASKPFAPLRVLRNLDQASMPRLDLYGDPLPIEAIARLGTVRLRHGINVTWLAFTPDGRFLVSQGGDGARIWNPTTGEQLQIFPSERELPDQMPFKGCSLSQNGKLLAVPGRSSVRIMEVTTGKCVTTIETGAVTCARLSPDAKTLAVQSETRPNPFQTWDVATGRLLLSGGDDPEYFAILELTENGKTLVTGGSRFNRSPRLPDHLIRFWDSTTGKELRQWHFGTLNPQYIVLSPDGAIAAVICLGEPFIENRIRIWDVAAGKEIQQLVATPRGGVSEQTNFSTAMAFSPDGKTLYAGGIDGELFVWDPRTGKELRRMGNGFIVPRSIGVTPDNKTLAVANIGSAIRIIDAQTGDDRLSDPGHRIHILQVGITPDGRSVVTYDQQRTFVWDAASGRKLHTFEVPDGLNHGFFLIDNGRKLLTAEWDKTRTVLILRVRDLASGKELKTLEFRREEKYGRYIAAVARDGKTLIMGRGPNETKVLVDLESGKELRELPELGSGGISFLADGRTIVVTTRDHRIRFWDFAAGRQIRAIQLRNETGQIPGVVGEAYRSYASAMSPDGRVLAYASSTSQIISGKHSFIEFYDGFTGLLLRKVAPLADMPMTLTLSPDGKRLAWGGQRSPEVHLLEVESGKECETFLGHMGSIWSLAFSADGRRLVSGSEDTTALVWDVRRATPARLTVAELDPLWSDLASEDAARAWKSLQQLAADPTQSVPFVAKRLSPVPPVDKSRLALLIADLDSDQFAVRENAVKELEKLGELALPMCRKALESQPTLEARRRIEVLLAKEVESRRTPSVERLRALRAVELLEWVGNDEARIALTALAKGAPGAAITEDAKAAIERLKNCERH